MQTWWIFPDLESVTYYKHCKLIDAATVMAVEKCYIGNRSNPSWLQIS